MTTSTLGLAHPELTLSANWLILAAWPGLPRRRTTSAPTDSPVSEIWAHLVPSSETKQPQIAWWDDRAPDVVASGAELGAELGGSGDHLVAQLGDVGVGESAVAGLYAQSVSEAAAAVFDTRAPVDIEEGNRAVRLMKQAVEASHGPDVIGGLAVTESGTANARSKSLDGKRLVGFHWGTFGSVPSSLLRSSSSTATLSVISWASRTSATTAE